MSHRKPDERRPGHREAPRLTVVRANGGRLTTPEPESGWLARTRAAWSTYWRDAVSTLSQPADAEALRRLFALYDARERTWRLFLKAPFTRGSKGQQVLNPMGAFALQLDEKIGQLERGFGITPRARLQLGITLGEAKRSLSDLAREAQAMPAAQVGE